MEKINKQVENKKEENESKLNELKIELLKQTQKRKGIKKEIARLFTSQAQNKPVVKNSEEKKK